jgi:hypothetical protein
MNKSLMTLAIFSLASGLALAEDPDPSGQFALQISSERTRADVYAEAVAAVAAGQLRPSNPHASAHVQPKLESTTTHEQVLKDFVANRAEAMARTSEDGGSTYLPRPGVAARAYEYATKGQ